MKRVLIAFAKAVGCAALLLGVLAVVFITPILLATWVGDRSDAPAFFMGELMLFGLLGGLTLAFLESDDKR